MLTVLLGLIGLSFVVIIHEFGHYLAARAMGVEVEEFPDGMAITGGKPLKGARMQSFGDHRIAMAFAVAGLFASGETVIEDTACVQTSYPTFFETLKKIQKGTGIGRRTPVISSLSSSKTRRRKKA